MTEVFEREGRKSAEFRLAAGQYYIGDPKHVINDYEEKKGRRTNNFAAGLYAYKTASFVRVHTNELEVFRGKHKDDEKETLYHCESYHFVVMPASLIEKAYEYADIRYYDMNIVVNYNHDDSELTIKMMGKRQFKISF